MIRNCTYVFGGNSFAGLDPAFTVSVEIYYSVEPNVAFQTNCKPFIKRTSKVKNG